MALSTKVILKPCPVVGEGNSEPVPEARTAVVDTLERGAARVDLALLANKRIVIANLLESYVVSIADWEL